MNDDPLSALHAEIERQNAAFEEVKTELSTLGDVEIDVPRSLLDELESLAAPPTSTCTTNINGLRA
ncbi:MAG TPA: hypothetical protein VM925_34505 [Labilithrix sp.]|jgi:hypothetical protein|nr:hypothetical protein [Labilithrix sp.]